MNRGYKSLTSPTDGHVLAQSAVTAALLLLLLTAGCGGGSSSGGADSAPGSHAAAGSSPPGPACPAAWAADWHAWADTIGAVVYCPSFMPSPFTGQIGGMWLTAKEPGRS